MSLENIWLAWQRFCQDKQRRLDVLAYARNIEGNMFDLQERLAGGQWRHGAYQPFVVHDPKRRQIHKATVGDRLVHQAVVNVIEPIWERQFIYDSYSCRLGKGTHAAVRRLRGFLQKASVNNTRTVYVLKCDVRRFFDSVDHGRLLLLLKRRVHDPLLLGLLSEIVSSFRLLSQPASYLGGMMSLTHGTSPGNPEYRPPRGSTISHKGLPLGNLTSQLFANVYLHELDRYVKFTLREQFYARYCDDFVIAHVSRAYLEELIFQIEAFLEANLGLQLHPAKIEIRTWAQGVDFLGYVLKPHATLLRTKTKRRMIARADEYNLASYLGLCLHADAHETEILLRHLVAGNGSW